MLRVGLTGGIAAGKSRVLRRFEGAGLHTLDLDRVAHDVMAPGGAAYGAVVGAFGAGILAPDGSVDRRKLGALVFADTVARSRLDALVHPRVREEEARRVAAWEGDPAAVVVTDAALLVEAGLHLRFDRLVVAHCPPDMQVRRLMERDGLDESAARARVAAQMPGEEKRRFAHYDIDTSGPVEQTDRAADALAHVLLALAALHRPHIRLPLERALACIVHGPRSGPRGLSPERLVSALADDGGVEMPRLARLLVPPAEGPWYRAARVRQVGPGPEVLAGALAIWSLTRGGADPDFLAGASASLARLTHPEGAAVATAVLFGQVFLDAAVGRRLPSRPGRRWSGAQAMAWRSSGAPAAAWAEAVLAAAEEQPGDPSAATAEARRRGAPEPALAGALAGLLGGGPAGPPAPPLERDLARLLGA